ncbi:GAF domain-containing protein [Corynebacterium lowii]|uniref:GAF domain-containing protein n=1 Tax=Corynebacterium lowii TaxID=1544413 RepID=A0A0Q0UM21_9CORY|nr:GAF domain-containing protein [Corynebacterium lowii]KQB87464.1 hypothetical protein Clow_00523 [Corynebacterium lowii]MDP9851942.1 hypothetical protein [Corynebacterium lowii]
MNAYAEVALPEPPLLRRVAGVRALWVELCGVVGTLLVAAASFVSGWSRALLFLVGAGCVVLALLIRSYQESRRRKVAELREAAKERQAQYIIRNLNMASVPARAALNLARKREQREYLHGARMIVVEQARNLAGQSEAKLSEVRAHYFGVERMGDAWLKAPDWGMAGSSGRSSERIFAAPDATFMRAMRGESCLIADAQNLGEEGKGLLPGSFVAAPVFAGRCLYGLLLVDSAETGAFTSVDEQIVMNLASLLAVTFAAQKEVPYIDMSRGSGDFRGEAQ